MKNYFDFEKKINMDCVGFDGKTSPADVMAIFQQAVTEHTLEMKLDFKSILEKYGAKWFIVSAHLEFFDMPAIDEDVNVRTWPLKSFAIKFPRAFVMTDKDGKKLAAAMTNWCIVDSKTNALMRAKTLEFPFDEFISDVPTDKEQKFPAENGAEFCYSRKILMSDIDLNRHVNNVSYIRIALDCFSTKEMENMDISALDIQYKLQCYEGEVLDLYRQKTENGYVIDGKRGDETIFRLMITIKKEQ